jgi:hypothetical protein
VYSESSGCRLVTKKESRGSLFQNNFNLQCKMQTDLSTHYALADMNFLSSSNIGAEA